MNADDSSDGYDSELDRDPAYGPPPIDDGWVDITRLNTQRLVPPDVERGIARRRQELADLHRARALRLRELASGEMHRFELSSSAAVDRLDEWLYLHDVLARTPAQEQQFAVLTRELLELEGALARQWEMVSGMLREAVNHEVSAEMLARTCQG
jgi:hypothetical protein